ncbi:MAG: thiol peroxidase [Gemmataceae bacterium]|nr:thiol peroxidase [Gemmataceae bacterium]
MARQLLFKGSPKNVTGPELKAGDAAPEFACVGSGLEIVTLASTPKKARLFSVVPSLDTSVCSMQTKRFDDAIASLKDKVVFYTVSNDMPFAQKRFCTTENLQNAVTLSDLHNGSFSKAFGVGLEGLPIPLTARSIFVVDKNDKVTYAEYVPEVTSHPNYDKVLEALNAAAQ